MQVSNVQSETQRRTWVRGVSRWVAPLGILALMPVLMGLGGCPCGDDADCTVGDFCLEGACVDCRDNADCPTELPVCVDTFCEECGGAADCDDGFACTTDTCDANNECVRTPVQCADGSSCTEPDGCVGIGSGTDTTLLDVAGSYGGTSLCGHLTKNSQIGPFRVTQFGLRHLNGCPLCRGGPSRSRN